MAALPEQARPRPGDPTGPRLLARSDSAGATHAFAAACVERGVGFSFGFPVDARIQRIVDVIPEPCWHPAIQTDGDLRDGAWVAEATGMIDLRAWPEGSRLILRKERPHPGAQLTFTDVDGMRITAILTDTPPGVVPGQAAGLELRHRQHARVEDRIREAKATGLRNLPCRAFNENAAWLEVVLTAVDLVCWTKLICFADAPSWPAARSPRSATASCTSPPGSPAPAARPGSGSTRPGAGPPRSPKASTDYAPRSPDHPRPASHDPGPGEPPTGSASRRSATHSPSHTPTTPTHPPDHAHRTAA